MPEKKVYREIFVLFLVVFLLAFSIELAKLLIAANDLGMMNGEYAFTTLDFKVQASWRNETWAGKRRLNDFLALFDGIINLSVKQPHGTRFKNYSQHLNRRMEAKNIMKTPLVSIIYRYKPCFGLALLQLPF